MTKRNRSRALLFLAIVALAALYVGPKMVSAALDGYRIGSEIRAQQGR